MSRYNFSTFGPGLSRRDWLKLTAAGVLGCSTSGWLGALAADAAGNPQRKRSCILLWMSGGPSQLDTFDLKPGHPHGGPFNLFVVKYIGRAAFFVDDRLHGRTCFRRKQYLRPRAADRAASRA